jgi:hypothetical protein
MKRILAIVLLSACDPVEPVPLTVELTEDGLPEISWDAGPAHEVGVWRCTGECGCDDRGELAITESASALWSVGNSSRGVEAAVESPVVYGQVDEQGWIPEELEVGVRYFARLHRYEECTPKREKCTRFDARGCEAFEL